MKSQLRAVEQVSLEPWGEERDGNGGLGYIKSYWRSPREHMEERGLQNALASGRKSSLWNEKTLDAGSLGPAE